MGFWEIKIVNGWGWVPIIKNRGWAHEQITLKKSIPKLLIEDHKNPKTKDKFPIRMVIPAKKFTVAFAKVGYLGLKALFDNQIVNHSKYKITQPSQVKSK